MSSGRSLFALVRRTVLVVVLIALGAALAAEEPNSSKVEVVKNVSYGPHEENLLDLFLPERGGAPRPLIVCIHGGGWAGGGKKQYHWLGQALAAKGFAV